jgi:hypothetical protein
MPRQSRIDAPGALHYVLIRDVERRKIFEDDADREILSSVYLLLETKIVGMSPTGSDTQCREAR